MNGSKLLVATLAGALVAFLTGGVLYVLVLGNFFAGQVGSATGVMRDPPNMPLIGLAQVPLAFVLAMVIKRWEGGPSLETGAKVGAMFTFLIFLAVDLMYYATTNVSTLTGALADACLGLVIGGISGAVIGMLLGRGAAKA
jgi:hypothetical protein